MLIEGLLGIALIIAAIVSVTKFVLEMSSMPVISDEEWELEVAKRSSFLDIPPAQHMPIDPPAEAQ